MCPAVRLVDHGIGASAGVPVVSEITGRDPTGSAAVGLSDVVLDVVDRNALQPPSADLNSTKLPHAEQGPDLVRVHVQLFGRLGDR